MLVDGFHLLQNGGPIMWPLLLCAILSVAVMLERLWTLRGATEGGSDLPQKALALAKSGREDRALSMVQGSANPAARLVETALTNRHLEAKALEAVLELQALEEMPTLSHRLNWLDTIITVSPLLGLLGTVTGMIAAFHVVGDSNSLSSPNAITGGVAQALIATATGLTIAIFTLVGYNALCEKVKIVVSAMELVATQAVQQFASTNPSLSPISHEVAKSRI